MAPRVQRVSPCVNVFVTICDGRGQLFDVSVLTTDASVDYGEAMTHTEKEPAPSIRAELGRRRLTVGRLATATKMSIPRIQRRLSDPDTLQLGEIARIATALDVAPGELLAAWVEEVRR